MAMQRKDKTALALACAVLFAILVLQIKWLDVSFLARYAAPVLAVTVVGAVLLGGWTGKSFVFNMVGESPPRAFWIYFCMALFALIMQLYTLQQEVSTYWGMAQQRSSDLRALTGQLLTVWTWTYMASFSLANIIAGINLLFRRLKKRVGEGQLDA